MIWSPTTAVQNGKAAKSLIVFRLSWSRRVDSNHRPADYEQAAARNRGGVLLIYDAYIRGGYGMCTGHNSGLFRPMWALHAAGVISDRPQGATRESKLLSVLASSTFADLADRTRSATR